MGAMILEVTNHELVVGEIQIRSISSSSVLLIGDTNSMQIFSAFDTPSDSLVISPLVPIAPEP